MSHWTDKQGRVHVGVMVGGRRVHRRLPQGTTARDAKLVEAEIRASIKRTAAARPVRIPDDPPLILLLAEYAEYAKRALKSPDTAIYHARRIGPWAEKYRASEARQAAAHIIKDLRGEYAPATINRSLGALGKALTLAWERGWTPVNYSSLIKKLPEHNARTTWLTMAQVQAIADHCSEQVQAAIWIAMCTGCRRGEICSIQRADIGRKDIILHAGNTKTGKSRSVPMHPRLRCCAGIRQTEASRTSAYFRAARDAAGMPWLHFHDLRHAAASAMINSGVPLYTVGAVLGHKSSVSTKRYAHLATATLRDAVGRIGQKIPHLGREEPVRKTRANR